MIQFADAFRIGAVAERVGGMGRRKRAEGVSNIGLGHLKLLSTLEVLGFRDTQVTDDGVKKLQRALPNCKTAL